MMVDILVDAEQVRVIKEALHVSAAPKSAVCRENEQNTIMDFCKKCVKQEKPGSMYISGCPGTGKSLSIELLREILVNWADEVPIGTLVKLFAIKSTFSFPVHLFCVSEANSLVSSQNQEQMQPPDILSMNCMFLAQTTEIFSKVHQFFRLFYL